MRKFKILFFLFISFFTSYFFINNFNIDTIISNINKNSIDKNQHNLKNNIISDNKTDTHINSYNSNFIEILVNENNLLEHLNELALTPRNYGSDGEFNSAQYLSQKLSEYGYMVEFQNFQVYKQDVNSSIHTKQNTDYLNINPYNSDILSTGMNIVARHPNFDKRKKTLYLSAHYDSTEYTTGVIDNATGCATILETARILQKYNSDINIGIIFFSAEEYFRYGSKYFISTLPDEDKANIIGCINVDMVGEKNAGDVVMQTPSGKNNIISSLIDTLLPDTFTLSLGGSSDDLSLYMGKIPVITLANKSSNYALDQSDTKTQIENLDLKEIATVVKEIATFAINFNTDIYSKILKTGLNSNIEYISKMTSYKNFYLTSLNQTFLENGFDLVSNYTYSNSNNQTFTLTERNSIFIPNKEYENYTFSLIEPNWGYEINANTLFFKTSKYYGTITGDIPTNELIHVLEAYYCNEYELLFKSLPTNKLFDF